MKIVTFLLIPMLVLISSCNPEAVPTVSDSTAIVSAGDILVTNIGSRSVVALNSDGTYKSVILQLDATVDIPYGVGWSSANNEVLVAINGSPDRIIAISAETGVQRQIDTSGLNGNIRQIASLSGGDIIVVETNNLERYTTTGEHITTGGWPLSGLQSTIEGLRVTSSGDILMCSRGSDVVGVYDTSGNVVAGTKASGIGSTTDCYGTAELGNGDIAVSWVGTTDTIAVYSSDLTSTVATFSDTGKIRNPRAIAASLDGTQFYVLDATYNNIHLFNNDGSYVSKLSPGVLSTPNDILIVPKF